MGHELGHTRSRPRPGMLESRAAIPARIARRGRSNSETAPVRVHAPASVRSATGCRLRTKGGVEASFLHGDYRGPRVRRRSAWAAVRTISLEFCRLLTIYKELWLNVKHECDPAQSDSPHDYFFFQAEDGIRDKLVTGVQTCALPI